MEAAVKILYSPEEQARQEIRSYVNEGLKDVQENAIYDFDEVFDALESRYTEYFYPHTPTYCLYSYGRKGNGLENLTGDYGTSKSGTYHESL
ncbi:MAG TPA: hypothetical protein DDY31_19050 [Lachnospiraceae bacterium]|nr:hypothetical protein [Lachnospiraceae bacterium]